MTPAGHYYDGRTAAQHRVRLLPVRGQVWVQGEGWERHEPIEQVQIGERLGIAAPRVIRFADGAACEVIDDSAFTEWLDAIGHSESAVDLVQRSWVFAIASLAIVVAAAFAGYRWGLPWMAGRLAERVPDAVVVLLSDQTLELLDDHLLEPTSLDASRQQVLAAQFARLGAGDRAQLLFRAGPEIGPNAMALPDGRIVLIDELVGLTKNDEEILAVLAHELGHVDRRHGLRLMIQSSVVGAFVAWWIGDFSPLIAGAPAAILQARHSRALEREADADASRRLEALDIEPSRLADMLERIAAEHGESVSDGEGNAWTDYLGSHPATRDRIRALRTPPPS